MTVSSTWKRAEREVARLFGAERAPAGSNNRPDRTASDSTHETLFIEVKYRVNHAVRTLWQDAHQKAVKEDKVPVLALATRGSHGKLLVIHEDDFDAVAACRDQAKRREANMGDKLEGIDDGQGIA